MSKKLETTETTTQTPSRSAKTVSDKREPLIAIGEQRIHVNAVTTKIREDIAFLEDRIRRMEQMRNPSQTVLNTYKSMLDSRVSVLHWLEEQGMVASKPIKKSVG